MRWAETSELERSAAALYSATCTNDRVMQIVDRQATLRTVPLGTVALPDGQLVACDPLTGSYDALPFERRVASGSYSVEVCIAAFADNHDQRVAAAIVRFSDEEPEVWDLAVLAGQDPAALEPGAFFGYPVDAGLGCFTSPDGSARLADIIGSHYGGDDAGTDDPLMKAMDATYVHTWGWANFDVGAGVNVVSFHSGFGDGVYPTYWGRSAAGSSVCAMTDFLLIAP